MAPESKSINEEFNIQDYYNQTLNKFNNIHSNVNDDYDTFETGVELAIQDLTDETNKSELFRCNNREECILKLKVVIMMLLTI